VRRRKLSTAHPSRIRGTRKSVYLGVIVHTLWRPFNLVRLKRHEDLGARWTGDSELAMVVGRIEGWIVWRGVDAEGFVLGEPDVATVRIRRWSCSRPEYSTEAEIAGMVVTAAAVCM